MATTKHITARIDPELHKQVKAVSDKQERTFSQIVEFALREYVKNQRVEKVFKKTVK